MRKSARGTEVTTLLLGALVAGCVSHDAPLTTRERAVAAAAAPLLELNPDYVWSACFNRLLDLAPASMACLARQPAMRAPAAPDDLRVMLHTSLMWLLADPTTAPHLSAHCYETSLDVLHFDIKVRGRRPGRVCMTAARPPRAWHELYPFDFDHGLAAQIDVEGDRQAMISWWRSCGQRAAPVVRRRRLNPRPQYLWGLLSRRFADRWVYLPDSDVVLCADQGPTVALFQGVSHDYNLVRATCVLLGTSADGGVQNRLIEMVGSDAPVLSHNARFALSFSRDVRIRGLIERYKHAGPLRDGRGKADAPAEPALKL